MKPQKTQVGDNRVAARPIRRHLPLADASQAAQAQQWLPLGYRQISTGRFNGLFESVELAGIELVHEQHDQAVYKTGCTPSNQCTISLIDRTDCATRFSQFSPESNESLFFLPRKTEFDVLVPAGCATSYVHLDQTELIGALELAMEVRADDTLESLNCADTTDLKRAVMLVDGLSRPLDLKLTAP